MKLFHSLLALTLVLAASFTQAENYISGQHYKVLENQTTPRDSSKIEVVEVFWYGSGVEKIPTSRCGLLSTSSTV